MIANKENIHKHSRVRWIWKTIFFLGALRKFNNENYRFAADLTVEFILYTFVLSSTRERKKCFPIDWRVRMFVFSRCCFMCCFRFGKTWKMFIWHIRSVVRSGRMGDASVIFLLIRRCFHCFVGLLNSVDSHLPKEDTNKFMQLVSLIEFHAFTNLHKNTHSNHSESCIHVCTTSTSLQEQ